MRIGVNDKACIGSGQCALALPEVFDQDGSDGTVVLLNDQPPTELHDDVYEVADRCPVRAIEVD